MIMFADRLLEPTSCLQDWGGEGFAWPKAIKLHDNYLVVIKSTPITVNNSIMLRL